MLDLSPEKLLVLGVIATIVLGPERLPELARRIGHLLGALRRMSTGFHDEFREAMREPGDALDAGLGQWRPADFGRAVRETVHDAVAPPPTFAAPVMTESSQPAPPASAPAGDQLGAGPAQPDDPSLN